MEISTKDMKRVTLVAPVGRIDHQTAPQLQKTLDDLINGGHFKLVLPHRSQTLDGKAGTGGIPGKYRQADVPLALYDLVADIGETTDVASAHPDVVARLQALAEKAREDLGDSLTKRTGRGVREPGRVP